MSKINNYNFEKLNDTIQVCVSSEHKFGTDAMLLADFSNAKRNDLVCDLGTGCGIIPFLLIRDYNPIHVFGIDIQQQAIEQFNLGIQKSLLNSKLTAINMDLKKVDEIKRIINNELNLITCNPPYKLNNTGIKNENLPQQIARHEIMCNISDICKTASKLLKFGGRLCMCQRPERLADVITAMKENDIEPKILQLVCKDVKSKPWLFLIEGKKGSKPFLDIKENLIIYSNNGEYSPHIKRIYKIND